jgi:hypothetical protein
MAELYRDLVTILRESGCHLFGQEKAAMKFGTALSTTGM